jgi:hypothetical protein
MAAHPLNLKANAIEDLTDDEGDLGLWAGRQKKYYNVPTLRIACQLNVICSFRLL